VRVLVGPLSHTPERSAASPWPSNRARRISSCDLKLQQRGVFLQVFERRCQARSRAGDSVLAVCHLHQRHISFGKALRCFEHAPRKSATSPHFDVQPYQLSP
jgi:hypothetical protein